MELKIVYVIRYDLICGQAKLNFIVFGNMNKLKQRL